MMNPTNIESDKNEPTFTLHGSDPLAHILVTVWAWAREELSADNIEEADKAKRLAESMDKWAQDHGGDMDAAWTAFLAAIETAIIRRPLTDEEWALLRRRLNEIDPTYDPYPNE